MFFVPVPVVPSHCVDIKNSMIDAYISWTFLHPIIGTTYTDLLDFAILMTCVFIAEFRHLLPLSWLSYLILVVVVGVVVVLLFSHWSWNALVYLYLTAVTYDLRCEISGLVVVDDNVNEKEGACTYCLISRLFSSRLKNKSIILNIVI